MPFLACTGTTDCAARSDAWATQTRIYCHNVVYRLKARSVTKLLDCIINQHRPRSPLHGFVSAFGQVFE